MHNPPHPGELIQHDVIVPLGLSLEQAARKFQVDDQYLGAVLVGKERLNTELAKGLQNAGVSTARAWLAMQSTFDRSRAV
ncbi:hypothetical protein ASL22_09215 [Alcaligenes faecalis]|nr:hypothetical protein ASL22_09215 [Alcaligenes faecalis]